MTEQRFQVTGMNCGHCADSITKEMTQVAGVSDVVVDLAGNAVTVRGASFEDSRVRAAITEAGYDVAGAL